MLNFQQDVLWLLPEFFFGFFILIFILWLLWLNHVSLILKKNVNQKLIFILIFYLFLVYLLNDFNSVKYIFTNSFVIDSYSIIFKYFIILSALCILVFMSSRNKSTYLEDDWLGFSILFILALFFMVILTTVFDLLSFYVVIEGLSLSIYSMAAFFIRHTKKGAEAAIKYFVVGLLSTGFFLFGIYLLYVETQQFSFFKLKQFFLNPEGKLSLLSYLGIISILFGFFFKLALVPCHIWIADVYEGVPTPITAFFSITVKLAIFSIFIRLFFFVFIELIYFWQLLLICSSLLSMLYGFLAAAGTDSIKRLMAFASINQVGYIGLGLACGTFEGIQSALIYLFLYTIMLLTFFGLLLMVQFTSFEGSVITITDFRSLYKANPICGWVFFVILLSMGGIPPFAGFLGKYYLFLAAIQVELYFTVFFAFLISAASIFVYLKIIKIILFETSKDDLLLAYNENNYIANIIIGFFTLYIIGWVLLNVFLYIAIIFGLNLRGLSFIFDLFTNLMQLHFLF